MAHQPLQVSAVCDEGMSARVHARSHQWLTDEPGELGGSDTAGTPVEMLLGALASCTALTVRMYATRKQWPVTTIRADVVGERDAAGRLSVARLTLAVGGDLDESQLARLHEIAHKCPVHKAIAGGLLVEIVDAKPS